MLDKVKSIKKLKIWLIFITICTLTLFITAIIHKFQLKNGYESYVFSPLTEVNTTLCVLLFGCYFINVFIVIKLWCEEDWRTLKSFISANSLLFLLIIIAIVIDAPLLVYAT